jgi:hypothetical protein
MGLGDLWAGNPDDAARARLPRTAPNCLLRGGAGSALLSRPKTSCGRASVDAARPACGQPKMTLRMPRSTP